MPRTLSFGSSGDDVAAAQRLLNYHLPSPKYRMLVVDGKFGDETRKRVFAFQTLNRNYLVRMPITTGDGVNKKPLEIDGIIGPNTGRVLLDVRLVTLNPSSRLDPSETTSIRGGRSGNPFLIRAGVGDPSPPAPTPPAPAPPPQTIRFLSLQAGGQAQLNPWALQPLVLTGQYSLLARNAGKPDFLLTAGGQISANLGTVNGDWSGQIFGQMSLGNINNFGLDLGPLDLVNPLVQIMLTKNQGQPISAGMAIGNQTTLTIIETEINGIKQPRLSAFFNLQGVVNVGLNDGLCSAPSLQGMLGLGWLFKPL